MHKPKDGVSREEMRYGDLGTNKYGHVKRHVWDITWLRCPERVDELTQCASKRICQTCHCRCCDTALFTEPHITVPCRCAEHKRLPESNEYLPKHDHPELARSAECC